MASGRGGSRENAGRKPKWNHGETQAIRVPKVFVNDLLSLAERLDRGECVDRSTMPDLHVITQEIMSDSQVTRNGKDKGAVKRTLEAVIKKVESKL